MPSPARIQYGACYHIFNRGNNRENIFIEARNYRYFLRLYARHVSPVAETLAYCLLKNHFHLAVCIKTEDQITAAYQALKHPKVLTPSRAFSNFFNAYAKSINKAYGRTGSLMQNPFKRIPIEDNRYLQRLIVYIHQNPQKHGFVNDFRDWPFSSYQPFLWAADDLQSYKAILDVFQGNANYQDAHRSPVEFKPLKGLQDL
jgi:REP element-mobilizing transposase RayT